MTEPSPGALARRHPATRAPEGHVWPALRRALLCAYVVLQPAGVGAASISPAAVVVRPGAGATTAGPVVVVRAYRARVMPAGPLCRTYVVGVLENNGPGLAGEISIEMTALRAGSGGVLGKGFGLAHLDVLAEGEVGPFEAVTAPFACTEEVGELVIEVEARPTTHDRYRGLATSGLVTRHVNGHDWVYGDVVNGGHSYVNAGDPATGVYVGYWSGGELVDFQAARMPVLNTTGDTGQPFPPGFRYPFSAAAPDQPYDRVETWVKAKEYPRGAYPVPLGVRDVVAIKSQPGVRLAATLANCGSAPAQAIVLVLVARSAGGVPVQFAVAPLEVADGQALAPGESGTITADWRTAGEDVEPRRVELYALALDIQDEVPVAVPCPAAMDRLWMPALTTESG